MILPRYEYSFGVKDYPVGQIVNVARRDISIPNQPWVDMGSYYSMKKRIRPGDCYNSGVNASYERMRYRG